MTDEQMQAWTDEAEAGDDVETLRKRGRKPLGSELIRAALRAYVV